ncbi:MAG: hypothetical protein KGJ09_02965 [Candidatus Omnitrophica bacterium]|nr:hypothetical protein [Candidatus Omnitrophota bacterium]MDE2009022.1 hypothetical protein [Candidatus Omnitrophota bacterium]MDE2214546.1 hypothetical protein [Candidatus Omnitrophota bacterium]MDE2230864.1 hypothetical protein [Candidatus Omnitrophota bacterium]
MNIKPLVLILGVLTLSGGFVFVQQSAAAVKPKIVVVDNTDPAKAVEVGNKICPVDGLKISDDGAMGGGPVKIAYKGRIYNLDCPMCIKAFENNPEKYSAIAEKEVGAGK